MSEEQSTRDRISSEIRSKHRSLDRQKSALSTTNVIAQIGDAEWTEMHTGTCALCPAGGARLYPRGWRCARCAP